MTIFHDILLIIAVLAAFYSVSIGVHRGWHWAILNSMTPAPRIPQFVLDTHHCWLQEKANRKWLEAFRSTKEALGALDSPIRPGNGALRTYPADLYQRLVIRNDQVGVRPRGGWSNAAARLKEILDCPAALQDVEIFQVKIYVSDGKYGIGIKERANPGAKLTRLFVEALTSMPNLRKLEWETLGSGNDDFSKAFANITLPSVTHLKPSQHMECLVKACPDLEVLEASGSTYWRWETGLDPRKDLIESTRYAKNLTSFAMKGDWELEHLEAVLKFMPNITRLRIAGKIERLRPISPKFVGKTLKSFVTVLSQFPKLEELSLPPSWSLGLGFDGGPTCGNAYFGRWGQRRRRSVSRRGAIATEEAASIVLPELPALKSFSVGGYQANLTKNENGTLCATWEWTGRMINWTYDMWPDKLGGYGSVDYAHDQNDLDNDSDEDESLEIEVVDEMEEEESDMLLHEIEI